MACVFAAAARGDPGPVTTSRVVGHTSFTSPDPAEADLASGLALDLGTGGGQPDPQRAFLLYLRAAKAGLPDAEFNVAVMYDSGRGTMHDASLAARWYAASAAAGVRRAAYDLGQLYEHGEGVPRNVDMARAWYHQAAGQGVSAARSRLRDRMLQQPDTAPKALVDAASPVAPADLSVIQAADRPLALVWLPASSGGKISYFVEVTAITHGVSDIVFTGDSDVSAVLTSMPLLAGSYAWRVFTIHEREARYTQSPWVRFSVGE